MTALGRKNGRRISPISHVLAAAYTWATPQNRLLMNGGLLS
jgi:hypothetical protein